MRAFRAVAAFGLVLALLCALSVFAWATHHPEDSRLTAARDWPVVGTLASWLQDTYLLPGEETAAPPDPAAPSPAPAVRARQRAGITLTKPWVWVKPGTSLFSEPSAESPVIATFDAYTNLPQIEIRDGWERVRWHGHDGWLPPPPEDGPRLGRAPDPPGPLLPRPPDAERLARARGLLGDRASSRSLGPYTLYTDSSNGVLIERLAKLSLSLDEVYAERFGRWPIGTPREAVVLFADEPAYRRLQAGSAVLVGANAAGHAGWGMAALYQGDRNPDDVAATFVHEITHLINRRAIGPALPPWLDEGLAEALASGRIQPWGVIEPRQWGGFRRQIGQRIELSGVRSTHLRVVRAIRQGTLPSLESMVALDADRFIRDTDGAGTRYATAGLFVRYLLDADDARWAPGFKGFLDDVANGGEASGGALLARLGTTWSELDAGFRAWVLETLGA